MPTKTALHLPLEYSVLLLECFCALWSPSYHRFTSL